MRESHAAAVEGDQQQIALARARLRATQEAQEEQEARAEHRRYTEHNWREAKLELARATKLLVEAQQRCNVAEEMVTQAEVELEEARAAERETRVLGPRRKRKRVAAAEPAPAEAAERAPAEVAVAEQSPAEGEPEPEEADWD